MHLRDVPRLACGYFLWLICFLVFLDCQWPWRAPWNWHSRDTLQDVACAAPAGRAAESNVSSGVEVIVAGVGQTGTTSVLQALGALGYRSYHIEEVLAFARGTLVGGVTPADWARQMSRCRVEAISLEPVLDLLPTAIAASPGAKVILTWRDFPSWKRSSDSGGLKRDFRWQLIMSWLVASGARMLPWLSFWDAVTGDVTALLMEGADFSLPGKASVREMLCFYSFWRMFYGAPQADMLQRGSTKLTGLGEFSEEAYLGYLSEVQRLVPEGKLLVLDVRRHGWGELARFLGDGSEDSGNPQRHPPPSPEMPLPHVRSKDSFSNDAIWMYATWGQRVVVLTIFGVMHAVNCAVLWAVLRAARGGWWRKS